MSSVSEVCDHLLDDLQANVPRVADCEPHRYAPWDPERFLNDGQRHLAIWPLPEFQTAAPLTTMAHEHTALYVCAYWEPAQVEDERQVADESAAADLFTTHDAIVDRFYQLANQVIGNTWKVWYVASATNDATQQTRFVLITFEVHRAKEFV